MKRVFIVLTACILVTQLVAQNLIDLNKDQVFEELKKSYPGFAIDNSTVNNTYKYIKCIDKFNDQTLLIFLSDKDISTATKLISDYSNLEEVKSNLNKNYKPKGKDTWVYNINDVNYRVKLKREEWFFTVFTNKIEK